MPAARPSASRRRGGAQAPCALVSDRGDASRSASSRRFLLLVLDASRIVGLPVALGSLTGDCVEQFAPQFPRLLLGDAVPLRNADEVLCVLLLLRCASALDADTLAGARDPLVKRC